jgi:AcrR family transcriptional regulator
MSYHHGDLKQALLQRAEEVIADEGVESVKLSKLAKDLGVSHSAPARHFKDRNALLAALAVRALESLKNDILQDKYFQHSNPRVRLNTLLKVQLRSVVKRPAHFFLMGNPDLPIITGPIYDKLLAEYSALLSNCVREAQKDGWHTGEQENQVILLALSVAVGLETMVRYAIKSQGSITSNELVSTSKDIKNALKAIDIFIPCQK